jgi:hypothetical protein
VNIVQDHSLVCMLTTLDTGCSADSKQTKYMHRFVYMHIIPCVLSIILHLMILRTALRALILMAKAQSLTKYNVNKHMHVILLLGCIVCM